MLWIFCPCLSAKCFGFVLVLTERSVFEHCLFNSLVDKNVLVLLWIYWCVHVCVYCDRNVLTHTVRLLTMIIFDHFLFHSHGKNGHTSVCAGRFLVLSMCGCMCIICLFNCFVFTIFYHLLSFVWFFSSWFIYIYEKDGKGRKTNVPRSKKLTSLECSMFSSSVKLIRHVLFVLLAVFRTINAVNQHIQYSTVMIRMIAPFERTVVNFIKILLLFIEYWVLTRVYRVYRVYRVTQLVHVYDEPLNFNFTLIERLFSISEKHSLAHMSQIWN